MSVVERIGGRQGRNRRVVVCILDFHWDLGTGLYRILQRSAARAVRSWKQSGEGYALLPRHLLLSDVRRDLIYGWHMSKHIRMNMALFFV